jgi:beta-glucosidase
MAADQVARLGEQVDRPEEAELAVVRLQAPFDPRSDLFLEAWFHQGSLDLPPGLPVRLGRIAERCPLVVDVLLDRPAVLTPLLPVASVLTAHYGTSDGAFVDALTGAVAPSGRLPFDLPRSMADVRAHPEDRPGLDDPLFPAGYRVAR